MSRELCGERVVGFEADEDGGHVVCGALCGADASRVRVCGGGGGEVVWVDDGLEAVVEEGLGDLFEGHPAVEAGLDKGNDLGVCLDVKDPVAGDDHKGDAVVVGPDGKLWVCDDGLFELAPPADLLEVDVADGAGHGEASDPPVVALRVLDVGTCALDPGALLGEVGLVVAGHGDGFPALSAEDGARVADVSDDKVGGRDERHDGGRSRLRAQAKLVVNKLGVQLEARVLHGLGQVLGRVVDRNPLGNRAGEDCSTQLGDLRAPVAVVHGKVHQRLVQPELQRLFRTLLRLPPPLVALLVLGRPEKPKHPRLASLVRLA